MERVLGSRRFVSFVAAAVTGLIALSSYPLPTDNAYLQVIAVKSPIVYGSLLYSYRLFFFTTPFIVYSSLLSLVFVFAGPGRPRTKPGALPPYPAPEERESLFLVLGERHHPTKPVPVGDPGWLIIPDRGLFTGIVIFGAIGTGKTSCCMRPFAEQLFSYKSSDPARRISGLVLEVKGDFCHQVKDILKKHGREEDYVELSLDARYCYNPLANDLDAYAHAYAIASLMANLYGRGKEPFWAMASTNLVKFIILLHKLVDDYVTLFDVYACAIDPQRLGAKLEMGRRLFGVTRTVHVAPEVFHADRYFERLDGFPFVYDERKKVMTAELTKPLRDAVTKLGIPHEVRIEGPAQDVDEGKRRQFEAVERWFEHDWMAMDGKLRTSIVEGISVFLSLFDDNPVVNRIFCPPKACYDPALNTPDEKGAYKYGKPLPSFRSLIEAGQVVALNFPVSLNPGLAKAIGTLMKMDYQRAVLLRIPEMAAHPERHFRETVFLCDEYQSFATCGEDNPNGDEKFFSLSRQPKCIPIVATQSVSSLKTTLPGETYRTLLQTFRTKIFLALSDDLSTQMAAELCGKEDKVELSYNISESTQEAKWSVLTGRTVSNRAGVGASKTYGVRHIERFSQKTFAELKNAQAIVIPYDGREPREATYCFLKPFYADPNVSWFEQAVRGLI